MKTESNSIFIADSKYSLKILFKENEFSSKNDFIRLYGGEFITFWLEFEEPQKIDNFSIHTNLSGSWDYLQFIKSKKSPLIYTLKVKLPIGGYFKFRLTATEGECRFWDVDSYKNILVDPPDAKLFKMYTFIPSVSGTISDWIDNLPRIKELGFNVIHLLPFLKMGSSQSPYSSVDLFKIDESYLDSSNSFDNFIDAAAALGLKICFDIVLNHISNESNLAKQKAHWLIPDPERIDGLKRAGCWHMGKRIVWEDLVLINYSHPVPAIKEEIYCYMKEYVISLIKKSKKCGSVLRLDNLHSSNYEFIIRLISEIKKEYPQTIIVSEYFGSEQVLEEGVKQYGLNMITANSWEYPFAPMLKGYLEHVHETAMTVKYFISPVSHDTKAVPELFGSVLSTIPRYFCCALMGTGQTGIVQGYEKGIEKKINFIGKPHRIKLRGEIDFSRFIQDVNNLLSSESVFQNYGNAEFENFNNDSLILCLRREVLKKKTFILAANFNTEESISFNLYKTGILEERLSYNAEWNLFKENEISVKLEKCGVLALLMKEG